MVKFVDLPIELFVVAFKDGLVYVNSKHRDMIEKVIEEKILQN